MTPMTSFLSLLYLWERGKILSSVEHWDYFELHKAKNSPSYKNKVFSRTVLKIIDVAWNPRFPL